MKNLIRSEEEKLLDHSELDLIMEKYEWLIIRHLIKNNNYYYAERIMKTIDYFKHLDKVRSEERLNPRGETDGIMFIGINPSEKSNLSNVWDDPFGQYFGKMLEEAGIDKSKVWMTNLYKKTTPENRPLNEEEIIEGMKELDIEIGYVNPSVIITLGKQVSDSLRNYLHTLPQEHISMHHPSYIKRNNTPEIRSRYLLELKKLKIYE